MDNRDRNESIQRRSMRRFCRKSDAVDKIISALCLRMASTRSTMPCWLGKVDLTNLTSSSESTLCFLRADAMCITISGALRLASLACRRVLSMERLIIAMQSWYCGLAPSTSLLLNSSAARTSSTTCTSDTTGTSGVAGTLALRSGDAWPLEEEKRFASATFSSLCR